MFAKLRISKLPDRLTVRMISRPLSIKVSTDDHLGHQSPHIERDDSSIELNGLKKDRYMARLDLGDPLQKWQKFGFAPFIQMIT